MKFSRFPIVKNKALINANLICLHHLPLTLIRLLEDLQCKFNYFLSILQYFASDNQGWRMNLYGIRLSRNKVCCRVFKGVVLSENLMKRV